VTAPIRTQPLTPEGFAPYGVVLSGDRPDVKRRSANQGTAVRMDWMGDLLSLRPGARPNLCLFRCSPRVDWPMTVEILEKHHHSTQLLVPMNATRYVVLVANGGDTPDLSTLAAFLAAPRQGIAYAPGTWHHPLIALDHETDFGCVVWEDESEGDNTLLTLAPEDRRVVVLE
jgi:ureidoglycolate lyase